MSKKGADIKKQEGKIKPRRFIMSDKVNNPGIEYSPVDNEVFNKHQDAVSQTKSLLEKEKRYQKYKYNFEKPINVVPQTAELASQMYVDAVNQSVVKTDALIEEERDFSEENKK